MAGEFYGETLDLLFECLASRRRRYVLACLRAHRTVTLADLADEVAEREFDQRIDEIPAETVLRIYHSLYHTHIPKLESLNLVEYDQAEDTVTAGGTIESAAPFLSVAESRE